MSTTQDPIKNGARGLIGFVVMAAVVVVGADVYLGDRVAEHVKDAEARVEYGACGSGRACTIDGLQADECNALTGGLWMPSVIVSGHLERAKVTFRARGGCMRGGGNVVEVVPK